MAALDHPTPRFLACLARQLFRFLTAAANVGGKAKLVQDLPYFVEIVALVHAHPLRCIFSGFRSLDDDTFDCRTHQLHIVAIGAVNRDTDRDTVPLGQQAAFDAVLAAVGRIWAGLSPQAAPW